MGDRTWTRTTIGGRMTRQQADRIDELAEDEGVYIPVYDDTTSEKIVNGPAPTYEAEEVNYGNLADLEKYLKAEGIPFVHNWGSGGDYAEGFYVFDGKTESDQFLGSPGDYGVPAGRLRQMKSIREVRAYLDLADFNVPDVEIVE